MDDRDVSLWEVLAYPDDVSAVLGDFASVIAAAYLNSLAFKDYPVRPEQILHMWTDGPDNGYCPTSGCGGAHVWDIDRIMQYLRSTW